MRYAFGLAAAAIIALPAGSSAQAPTRGSAVIVPRAGYINYSKSTGIKPAPFVGVDLMYNLSRFFSVGPSLMVSQPETNGEDFGAALIYGDTTYLFRVTQPLTVFNASLNASAHLPTYGRVSPFITGGVGYYTLYLDPQVSNGSKRFGRMSLNASAGAAFRFNKSTGIELSVGDMIFTDNDRNRLNPVTTAFQNRFAEEFPVESSNSKTAHNLVFGLGFTFTPSGNIETDEEDKK